MTTTSTTRTFFRNSFALVLFVGLTSGVFALDSTGFARSLEAESDWYRAISLWKQMRFEATTPAARWAAEQAILADLWAAQQWESGLAEVARAGQETDSGRGKTLATWNGLFLYKLSQFPAAEYSLSQGGDPLYLGLLMAKTGRSTQAKVLWNGLNLPDPTIPAQENRSELLAAGLSLVLPGAGQAYSGHWFDGAQAFAFVGFFGAAAYGTYLYDSKVSGNYSLTSVALSIAALFHISNVYGAYKTAGYFNQNQEDARIAVLENAVFQRALPSVP